MTQYRTQFIDGDYRRNPKTDTFCCACQKDIKGEPRYFVHLVDGGAHALHPEDEELYVTQGDKGGDCGSLPIGPDCARRLGMEFVTKTEEGS